MADHAYSGPASAPAGGRKPSLRPDGEMAPMFMYKLVIAFGVAAFVFITIGSLLGVKAVDLPVTEPDLVRDIQVINDGSGTVELRDVADAVVMATFDAETRNPIRDVFRRFDLMRVAASKPPIQTYRVLAWDRGDIAITAADVKFRINIPAGKSTDAFSVLTAPKTGVTGG
ncbi:MAG: hypothetical protein AAGH82_01595 [Pseudomonadota bacterium]